LRTLRAHESTGPPFFLCLASCQLPASSLVGLLRFAKLAFQDSSQDQDTARLHARQNPQALGDQQSRDQVGANDIVTPRGAATQLGEIGVGEMEFVLDAIETRVGSRDKEALRVEVKRVNRRVTKLCGRDG
jgi:hypothetical protein